MDHRTPRDVNWCKGPQIVTGIRERRLAVVRLIAERGQLTIGQIAEAFGATQSAVGVWLCKCSWLSLDRKSYRYSLSESGLAALETEQ